MESRRRKNESKFYDLAKKIGKLEAENKRLREALESILYAAQKDEPCIMAIKVVAYTTLKGDEE